jgi:N-acetylmuramoyl-L-alanine amidase
MTRPFGWLAAVGAAVALLVSTPRAQQTDTATADAIRAQAERALTAAPRNYGRLLAPAQAGVRVLGVQVRTAASGAESVTIDLSQRALTYDPSGNIEPLLDTILQATASSVRGVPLVEYHFTIDGIRLEQFLPAPARIIPRTQPLNAAGTVLISPGHGLYWDESRGEWHLQRPRLFGIVEDVVNWDIGRYLLDELLAANINARLSRYTLRDAAAGLSGSPRWEEGAKYFIETLGAPADVWNFGADDYARDINARPFYANWIDAATIISIHNNGGQETGTETWYDATNGSEAESSRLAEIVQRHVVAAIRARYNAAWIDRGLRSCDGCKGENRLATRPAVIVELAYMDTQMPDNDALHDEAFKRIVAQAISEAIQEWASAEDRPAPL